ncbi:hypothetical protein N7453_007607 [Penicillium expansum]|nr:hypothetical protein N7453_007607 [Penicillium expansum]
MAHYTMRQFTNVALVVYGPGAFIAAPGVPVQVINQPTTPPTVLNESKTHDLTNHLYQQRAYWLWGHASLFDILPRASSNCTTYTVGTGDTCTGIGKSQDVTWAQLLAWNSQIDSTCFNLGSLVNTTICVSNLVGNYGLGGMTTIVTTTAAVPSPTGDCTNSRCGQYYKVAANETCTTMTDKSSISRNNLLFLNPELFQNCTNLLADTYYCVQLVGYIATYLGYGQSLNSKVPFNETFSTSLPSEPPMVWPTGSSPIIPLANGTRTDCTQ